jgi:hypothetical protein
MCTFKIHELICEMPVFAEAESGYLSEVRSGYLIYLNKGLLRAVTLRRSGKYGQQQDAWRVNQLVPECARKQLQLPHGI